MPVEPKITTKKYLYDKSVEPYIKKLKKLYKKGLRDDQKRDIKELQKHYRWKSLKNIQEQKRIMSRAKTKLDKIEKRKTGNIKKYFVLKDELEKYREKKPKEFKKTLKLLDEIKFTKGELETLEVIKDLQGLANELYAEFKALEAEERQLKEDNVKKELEIAQRKIITSDKIMLGRNELCPMCKAKGVEIKWKKCKEHNI